MKKLLLVIILSLITSNIYSQPEQLKILSSAKENSNGYINPLNSSFVFPPTMYNSFAPVGTVPFPINYCDYVTDGFNMRRIVAMGDTIIIAADINSDKSGPPPVSTVNRIYYQVSYDGGLTWLSDAINTDPATSNRWPNIFPIFNAGSRSLVFMGTQNATT
jgi:hypothetical protein